MVERLLNLMGPLAYPECRRASRRGYLIWFRMLPAVAAAAATGLTFAIGQFRAVLDPSHHFDDDARILLGILVGGGWVLILLLAPALLAGSLAGEKERGSIALLLSTEASARDIVLARWAACVAALGLVVAAGVPFLVGLLALGSYPLSAAPAIVAMTFALALGGGGTALAISSLSKRGRDALLLIYLLDIVALVASSFVARAGASGWLILALNPFLALGPLIERREVVPAFAVAAGWSVLGVLGLAVASWRLRPSCLSEPARRLGSARRGRWRRVPPVGEHPMLWKELHIDRAGSLGRVGRWLGGLIALWLGLGSVALALWAVADGRWSVGAGKERGFDAQWAIEALGTWYGGTAVAIGLLIQWSIGLRSAVMVASERERGTWDALLTSPLTPAAIVGGKLGGSWFALRWLVGSTLVAWTLAVVLGGMTPYRYALAVAEALVWGTLMAALGLAMSLRTATATRAMAATVAGWCLCFACCKLIATLGTVVVMGVLAYLFRQTGATWFVAWLQFGSDWGSVLVAELIAALSIWDTFARFDRIAGRATGGDVAAAIDRAIYGRPMAPVRLDATRQATLKS